MPEKVAEVVVEDVGLAVGEEEVDMEVVAADTEEVAVIVEDQGEVEVNKKIMLNLKSHDSCLTIELGISPHYPIIL